MANIYPIGASCTREESIRRHRADLADILTGDCVEGSRAARIRQFMADLREDDLLGCWCNGKDYGEACHGETIIEFWRAGLHLQGRVLCPTGEWRK